MEGVQSIAHIQYDKELTVDERRSLTNESLRAVREAVSEHGCSKYEAELVLVSECLLEKIKLPGVLGYWHRHPISRINECNKLISFVKDTDPKDWERSVALAHDATTFAIDSFFQQTRRRLSMLERPISSQSANRRVWTGKSPYNPEMIYKVLQIFRTYHNYCLKSAKDGKTPAQRLGLARGAVEIRKIIG